MSGFYASYGMYDWNAPMASAGAELIPTPVIATTQISTISQIGQSAIGAMYGQETYYSECTTQPMTHTGTIVLAREVHGGANVSCSWGDDKGVTWSASANVGATDDRGNSANVKVEVDSNGNGQASAAANHSSESSGHGHK